MSSIFKVVIKSEGNVVAERTPAFVDIFAHNFINIFGSNINNIEVTQDEAESLNTSYKSLDVEVKRVIAGLEAIRSINTFNSNFKIGDIKSIKSVIQLDMDGNEIYSNEYASFSETKEDSKNLLGSIEKINENEILIADSVNKRAIIVDINDKKIKWEYNSDRYIYDAHLIPYEIEISINDGEKTLPDIVLNKNNVVTWTNNCSYDIVIYSGDVIRDDFGQDFSPSLYGKYFKSDIIKPLEVYTKEFETEGMFGWFSYPNPYIGKIVVQKGKFSPLDNFIITEGDGTDSQFTNRIIKVNSFGNILWTYGEGFLVKPRDARPLSNNKFIIST